MAGTTANNLFALKRDNADQARRTASLQRHPLLYRLRVLLYLLLGGAMFGSVLLLSLVMIVAFVALLLTGKGAILALKLAKVVWVVALALWGMLRIGWRMLSRRRPMPEGVRLTRAEAPGLFAALDKLRQQIKGPRIDAVYLDTSFNAWALSRPLGGFWFVPWRRHFIGLGVPLIQTLSADEALAVLAHEYGHISGHPNRFDAMVYRLRHAMVELLIGAQEWTDWPSRLLCRMMNWYIPRFDRLVFALCRAAEYAADRASGQLVSPQQAGQALLHSAVAHPYVDATFWGRVYDRIDTAPEPDVRPWSDMARLLRDDSKRNDNVRDITLNILRQRLQAATDENDTHPALADRLQALGLDAAARLQSGEAIVPVAERTAAEVWFGDGLAKVMAPLDDAWRADIEPQWRERHTEINADRERLQVLDAQAAVSTLGVDDAWEHLRLRLKTGSLKGEPADVEVNAFLERYPRHPDATLMATRRWVGADTPKANRLVFELIESDPGQLEAAAGVLSDEWGSSDPHRQRVFELLAQRARDHGALKGAMR